MLGQVILTSTYTANLASFFTKSGLTLHGPTDISSLATSSVCVPHAQMHHVVGPFVGTMIHPDIATGATGTGMYGVSACGNPLASYEDQNVCCMAMLQQRPKRNPP